MVMSNLQACLKCALEGVRSLGLCQTLTAYNSCKQ
jgi:hypothetical protein